jgi:hypothetical protein
VKKALQHWFTLPVIASDEENKHRVTLMNAMINASVIFILFIFCGNLLNRSTPFRNYVIDLVILALFLMARRALRKGKVFFVGIGTLTLGFILTIVSIASDGTVRSTAVSLLLLVIIISGILFEINGIVISTIASSLAVLVLVVVENAGMLPRPDYSPSFLPWFFLTITFALVGGHHLFLKSHYVASVQTRRSRTQRTPACRK